MALTTAMRPRLRLPGISLALNELVVKGRGDKRRGEEDNIDMDVVTHREGVAREVLYRYGMVEEMSFLTCTVPR